MARERLSALISGGFALSGLLLASLGLYALLAYSVTERYKGIRSSDRARRSAGPVATLGRRRRAATRCGGRNRRCRGLSSAVSTVRGPVVRRHTLRRVDLRRRADAALRRRRRGVVLSGSTGGAGRAAPRTATGVGEGRLRSRPSRCYLRVHTHANPNDRRPPPFRVPAARDSPSRRRLGRAAEWRLAGLRARRRRRALLAARRHPSRQCRVAAGRVDVSHRRRVPAAGGRPTAFEATPLLRRRHAAL